MSENFRFGASKDIITPCMETTMMGFGSVYGKPFEGIHDDLYVRVLQLQDENNTIFLIALDLLFHDDSLPDRLRAYVKDKYGVPYDNLLVIYTHTHYGPVVKGYDFVFYNEAYEEFLFQRISQCIDRTYLNLCEGTMEYSAVDGEWNISRRRIENGVANPSILPSPDGDADKKMYLLKLSDTQGRIRAMAVNFACHPSNLNTYTVLSGEYPARLCHMIEAYNYGCTALFFQGAGGDSKLKIGAKSSKFHPITYDECNEVASSMALRVQNALLNGKWKRIDVNLASKMFKIQMPLDVYPKSVFEEELRSYTKNQDVRFDKSMINDRTYTSNHLFWACSQYIVDHYDEMPDYIMLNCGVIRLADDFYIFTVGGEPSVDVKRVLERIMTDKTMLFFGYNDAIAYVPSDKMLKEGGYEAGDRSVVEYRMKGSFRFGMDERFIKGFKEAMESLG
ncbi:MAG: neutral/alkaline non-lysosomal ceramidase N-terminal domain-containing protein [Clostridia bacterium]|mgnify:CR=1 FL=1|jgi:neutral ceramidase|nr:hypothetical protein [Clostridiaceae bacterium]